MSLEMKYFVLKPRSKYRNDPYANAARRAMWEYAYQIEWFDGQLGRDVRELVQEEAEYARTLEVRTASEIQNEKDADD